MQSFKERANFTCVALPLKKSLVNNDIPAIKERSKDAQLSVPAPAANAIMRACQAFGGQVSSLVATPNLQAMGS